ncbi:heat-inducible transcriptional repressor HrcA [Silanimonas sp.]|jgi:heat-inducible transcriptional repressor|uniref:heat-inducible transcriptional repressor HrcA n=2 Tax=Silanimonas sp. TaxID=1929290 RepID=UPI0037CC8DE7
MSPSSHRLDPRARQLLRSLVHQYIAHGEPVGSRTLAKQSGLDVSAATIRNIMADLEELGLVAAPHTSAGRIPTSHGYRVFVDSLIELPQPDEGLVRQLAQQLPQGQGTQGLLAGATELLSSMSHSVGVITVPQRAAFAFRHIEFVPIDAQRVLVVIVFMDHEVQNRIIQTRRPYAPDELEQTSNYLNRHYAGRGWADIRAALLRELQDAKSELERTLAAAVELSEQVLPEGGDDVLVAGQTRLMGSPDMADVERLRGLFDAFAQKREILGLLERCARAQGVRIFIGEETGLAPFGGCTVVTAPYAVNGRVLGVLGVIGPTRMAYEQVIPMVQATAQLVGQALKPSTPAPQPGRTSPNCRHRRPWKTHEPRARAGRSGRGPGRRCAGRTPLHRVPG